jgi:formylglycine-generating enzyme required for sulfatase activity
MFEEYDRFAEDTSAGKPNDEGWGRGRRPVINMRWYDAAAYVDWLRQVTGEEYRLPTEAEWEYACRAGTTTMYAWGNEASKEMANYSADKTTKVGAYSANKFGLYDMHGNVWEWIEDIWHENYEDAPADGSAWSEGSNQGARMVRGGSWINNPNLLRSAYRIRGGRLNQSYVDGIRVARTLL